LPSTVAAPSVVPSPAKETPTEVVLAWKEKPINLEALFSGDNSFDATQPDSPSETATKPLD
jgi:hypothetical protein